MEQKHLALPQESHAGALAFLFFGTEHGEQRLDIGPADRAKDRAMEDRGQGPRVPGLYDTMALEFGTTSSGGAWTPSRCRPTPEMTMGSWVVVLIRQPCARQAIDPLSAVPP